jgi:hypothetical protein
VLDVNVFAAFDESRVEGTAAAYQPSPCTEGAGGGRLEKSLAVLVGMFRE